MWMSRRLEALRRAAEMSARAELVRAEAEDTRRLAEDVHDDHDVRRSFESAALTMDLAAQSYERTADEYRTMYGGAEVVQDSDDDADGL